MGAVVQGAEDGEIRPLMTMLGRSMRRRCVPGDEAAWGGSLSVSVSLSLSHSTIPFLPALPVPPSPQAAAQGADEGEIRRLMTMLEGEHEEAATPGAQWRTAAVWPEGLDAFEGRMVGMGVMEAD